MATDGQQGSEWLRNGFPPRSFPVEAAQGGGPGSARDQRPAAVPPKPSGSERSRRGWWVAAVVVVLAVLLGGTAAVIAARRDNDKDAVAGGATSTSEAPATTVVGVEATLPTTTSTEATTTTVGPSSSTSAVGALETSVSALTLPKADATTGVQETRLTLRNTGATALSYTTQASTPGLTVAPARGSIAAGASVDLTVSLDALKVVTEGPFNGTLSIGGTGGVRTVSVTSTTGRPPSIIDDVGEGCPAAAATTCSRQIKLAKTTVIDPSPCNTPWQYSVTINDQSQIQSAKALGQRGLANADTSLASSARTPGGSGVYRSNPFAPIPAGLVLHFAIEAIDQYGYTTRLAEQTITC